MANSLEAVPPGFRFDPTDEQLVGHFLYKFLVENEPLPPLYNSLIHVCNLFGDESEPAEIWEKYGGGPDQPGDHQELYFISKIKRLTRKRIDRKSGRGGTWTEKEKSKPVMNGNHNPIGLKRKFRYVNEESEDDGRWLLDEYSLFSGPKNPNDKSYDFDIVTCRMRTNDRSAASRVHKRICSSQDVLEEKPKNKKMKKDHVGSIGSSPNMNAMINSTDEEVPPLQGCSSALATPDNNDYPTSFDDDTVFTLQELFPEDYETYNVSSPAASGLGGVDGGAEGACNNLSFDTEELSSETCQVALQTASGLGCVDGGAEGAYNPSFDAEKLSSETYQVALPTASRIGGADGEVEAWNPNIFQNLLDQPLIEFNNSTYSCWSESFMDEIMPAQLDAERLHQNLDH